MADHVVERGPVEQGRGQYVKGVEPAPGLVDVLHDEISREVVLEPLLVLERIVDLGEGHRPRFEPAVQHLGHPAHHRLPGGVVGVGPGQLVDERPVQVHRPHAEVPLDLVQASVDVHSGIGRIVAAPRRDGRSPEPVAADRPVAGAFQPGSETPVAHMPRHPVDLLVQRQHLVPDLGHPHEPRAEGSVDDGLVGAPAVRIVVLVGGVAQDPALLFELGDDAAVGLEHVEPGPVGHLLGEAALVVHRHHRGQPVGLGGLLVVLSETGGGVDHTGALGGVHEVGPQYLEGTVGAQGGEVVKQRPVASADQLGARHGAHYPALAQLGAVGLQRGRGQHNMAAVMLHHGVVDLGSHDQHQVGRQGPRRGGPGQNAHWTGITRFRHQVEGHGDGRILAGTGGVVEADLEVGQRGLGRPGVGHHPIGLIDQALVPQRLEGPHNRLHVGQVHGLVVVGEVHPAGLAGNRGLPLLGVAQHRLAAVVVEPVDAVAGDGGSP